MAAEKETKLPFTKSIQTIYNAVKDTDKELNHDVLSYMSGLVTNMVVNLVKACLHIKGNRVTIMRKDLELAVQLLFKGGIGDSAVKYMKNHYDKFMASKSGTKKERKTKSERAQLMFHVPEVTKAIDLILDEYSKDNQDEIANLKQNKAGGKTEDFLKIQVEGAFDVELCAALDVFLYLLFRNNKVNLTMEDLMTYIRQNRDVRATVLILS
jgi:hypothetical protein